MAFGGCPSKLQILSEPLLISPSRAPGLPTFARLITNPDGYDGGPVVRVDKPLYSATRAYLRRILVGDGQKAHCPFVQFIEDRNGYHLRPIRAEADTVDIEASLQLLIDKFQQLSPAPTLRGDRPDPTIVIISFGGPGTSEEAFCTKMSQTKAQMRHLFLQAGLMVNDTTPFHPVGDRNGEGQAPMFVSEVPILMVRRMHILDHIFMKDGASLELYARIFGPPGIRDPGRVFEAEQKAARGCPFSNSGQPNPGVR